MTTQHLTVPRAGLRLILLECSLILCPLDHRHELISVTCNTAPFCCDAGLPGCKNAGSQVCWATGVCLTAGTLESKCA